MFYEKCFVFLFFEKCSFGNYYLKSVLLYLKREDFSKSLTNIACFHAWNYNTQQDIFSKYIASKLILPEVVVGSKYTISTFEEGLNSISQHFSLNQGMYTCTNYNDYS